MTVLSVLPETPASKAGLKSGDQVVEIGDESTVNMSLNDAVGKLRGDPGTQVTALIQRRGWPEPRVFTMTRAEIHIQSVTSEVLGDGIGYARLRHFQEDTEADLSRRLDELRRKGSLKGLVLDLRQNPGGLLEQSVAVGNVFIRKGTIVVTEGEGKRMRQAYTADGEARFADVPVVVLVDGGSASAAEIVAGALKNDGRALLVGDTTFGKGTVQVIYEVGDGALKLTVAQYLTPGDISIQGVGVTPDVEMLPVSVAADRLSLGVRDDSRDHDPKRKLEAFGRVAHDTPLMRIPFLLPPEAARGDSDEEDEPPLKDDRFERDQAISLAAAILRQARTPTRQGTLDEASSALKAWTADQDVRITEALRGRGIDWTAGPARTDAPATVSWSVDRPGPLAAGAKVKLRMTARNEGREPLFRVRCVTESDSAALDAREFVFGRVGPGESVTREVPLAVPKDSWDRIDQVTFHLFQGEAEGPQPAPVVVATRGLPRPRFAWSYQVQDAAGNGDGLLNPGESAGVVFDIRDVGDGAAQKVLVTLRNKSGDGVYIREGRVTLRDGIPIGRTQQARFKVELRRGLEAPSVTLEVGILDMASREYVSEELTLPVVRPSPDLLEERTQALRTRRNGVPVLASASDDSAVLFELPASSFLRSTGRIHGFNKVDLEEGRFAFVRPDDVEPTTGVVRFSELPDAPVATRAQPAIEVGLQGLDPSGPAHDGVEVAGRVRFAPAPPGGASKLKVLIFRGNDKVYFWTGKGAAAEAVVPVDAQVRLAKGKNEIAVYAIEGKDRSAVRRFTLFSEPAPGGRQGVVR